MMKISIITPSFNQAEFLEDTIQSVLGQKYSDLEYLIVDGGSTDGSVEIIQKYADRLTWWISEPDGGQAEAINKGFTKATGEIVAWLNSDDLYAPGAIKEATAFLSENPQIGLVYGNAVSFDQEGVPLNDLKFESWGLKELVAFNIICQPAVFFRRDVLEKAGYLNESYHLLLDHEFWLRMARKTRIQHIEREWAFARHHPDAKNVSRANEFSDEVIRILDWVRCEPDLAEIYAKDKRTIMAMAHRFIGRYFLDGGRPWSALKSYGRSFQIDPRIALKEWHRIVFAGLSILGFSKLGGLYYQAKRNQIPESVKKMGIENINSLYTDKDGIDG
jgi:glycosyltransferase involved in cell wall biosynthesis